MSKPSIPFRADPCDAVVNPQRPENSPGIGSVAVMAATRPDLFLLGDLLSLNKNAFQRLFTSRMYVSPHSSDGFSVTGPFVGAPYAVMLLESLIVRGARHIIFMGWCGAVSDRVKIGDIILPTSVVIDEGTSRHYGAEDDGRTAASFPLVSGIRQILKKNKIDFHPGAVWSTDAIFRETRQQVATHQQNGILAVDMETSALFSAAKFRAVDLGAILVVSDELSTLSWRPGFKHQRFLEGRKIACTVIRELIFEVLKEMGAADSEQSH
jgi:purine-nucleoside phosphorylase